MVANDQVKYINLLLYYFVSSILSSNHDVEDSDDIFHSSKVRNDYSYCRLMYSHLYCIPLVTF